jgi:hypothetical protein
MHCFRKSVFPELPLYRECLIVVYYRYKYVNRPSKCYWNHT